MIRSFKARAWRADTQAALRKGTMRAPTRTTLEEAADDWLVPPRATRRARRIWTAAGLEPIGLHECRHTYAAHMIAAGVNASALQATPRSRSPSTATSRLAGSTSGAGAA